MNIHCLLGNVTLDTWQLTAMGRINNSGDKKCYGGAFIFQSTSAPFCLTENENWCSYLLSYMQRGGQSGAIFIGTAGYIAYINTRKA